MRSIEAASVSLPVPAYLMLRALVVEYVNGRTQVHFPLSCVGAAKVLDFHEIATWVFPPKGENGVRVSLTSFGREMANAIESREDSES
jgi:hypothetical protein